MNPRDAWRISEDLLSGTLPQRWKHVQGVAARAGEASVLFVSSDSDLLQAAAILHDVGYASKIVSSGFHALDGARHLKEIGVDGRLCSLVAHHSCAYREAELRGLSAELAEWTDEATALRDALWWADMTTTPDGESTNVYDRIEEIQERYGPEDLVTFFIRQARSELIAAVERTNERLDAAGAN